MVAAVYRIGVGCIVLAVVEWFRLPDDGDRPWPGCVVRRGRFGSLWTSGWRATVRVYKSVWDVAFVGVVWLATPIARTCWFWLSELCTVRFSASHSSRLCGVGGRSEAGTVPG